MKNMKKWFLTGGAFAALVPGVVVLSSAFRAVPGWPGPFETGLLLIVLIILGGIGAISGFLLWWIIAAAPGRRNKS